MLNYIRQNHLALLIILWLVGSSFLGATGVPRELTTFTNPITLDQELVVNESGASRDSRIEGDTDANLLFVDASTDRVGVGTSTPDVLFDIDGIVDFHGYGDAIYSTSTDGVLTEDMLLYHSGIYITPTGAGQAVLALTLSATSTWTTLIPSAGQCQSWWIDASDVAAATTTTITAGTGWNVVGLDATGAGAGADVIDGAEYGKLTACRETDTDIVGFVEEWIHAD